MNYFLIFCFIFVSISMVLWGVYRKDRFYQYPTIAGATWLFYLVPQVIGSLRNTTKFPVAVLEDGGMEIALIMCILCSLAGWLGYSWEPKQINPFQSENVEKREYSIDRLFKGGVVLYLIGFIAAYKLAQLAGGFTTQFTGGGHYDLEWRGLPVAYSFFARLKNPALFIVILTTLAKPSVLKWLASGLFSVYPLCIILFLGRRSAAAYFVITVLLALYFRKRWSLPRPVMLLSFVLAGALVTVASQYRAKSQYGLSKEVVRDINVKGSVEEVFHGYKYSEFDAMVIIGSAINKTMSLGFGVDIYNSTVSQLVPRQIVGTTLKKSLYMKRPFGHVDTYALYSWKIPYGSNPTGPLTAFSNFWFFGAFLYFLMGRFYKFLWRRCILHGDFASQVWYGAFILIVPMSIYGTLNVIPGAVLPLLVFIYPVLKYSKLDQARETSAVN